MPEVCSHKRYEFEGISYEDALKMADDMNFCSHCGAELSEDGPSLYFCNYTCQTWYYAQRAGQNAPTNMGFRLDWRTVNRRL